MIRRLELVEILQLVRATPEQTVFDWKYDFRPPSDEEGKGEIVKDVMAIANGTAFTGQPGYIVYGVNPMGQPDPFLGVSRTWDDASLQQLAASVLDPVPQFLLYEADAGQSRTVVVLHVEATRQPFHVAVRGVGKLREGQSVIRQGSSTRGVTRADHLRLYLTPGFGYVEQVLQRYGAQAHLMNAQTAALNQNQQAIQNVLRQMEAMTGLPRGSLG